MMDSLRGRRRLEGVGMTSRRTRNRMVERLRARLIRHPSVLDAMGEVPRHLFMDEALASRAYEDAALPIGYGQTISQPYIMARMTEALVCDGVPQTVLEVGTGSGYQAAILSRIVPKVYTVERIRGLSRQAQSIFRELGYRNIIARHSDGTMGLAKQAPFDAIVVTAAPTEIPSPLLPQLAVGGRLVIPVGRGDAQELVSVTRSRDGFESTVLDKVKFVPLLPGAC